MTGIALVVISNIDANHFIEPGSENASRCAASPTKQIQGYSHLNK